MAKLSKSAYSISGAHYTPRLDPSFKGKSTNELISNSPCLAPKPLTRSNINGSGILTVCLIGTSWPTIEVKDSMKATTSINGLNLAVVYFKCNIYYFFEAQK